MRAAIALSLCAACSGVVSNTTYTRVPVAKESVTAVPGSDEAHATGRLVDSGAGAELLVELSTLRTCVRDTLTTITSTPNVTYELESPGVAWFDGIAGVLLLGAGVATYLDVEKVPVDRRGEQVNLFTQEQAKYFAYGWAGLGAIFELLLVGNLARSGDEIGAPEVTTEQSKKDEPCELNRFAELTLDLAVGSVTQNGIVAAKKSDGSGYGPVRLPLDAAALAELGSDASVVIKAQAADGSRAAATIPAEEVAGLLEKSGSLRQANAAREERRDAQSTAWARLEKEGTLDELRAFAAGNADFEALPAVSARIASLENEQRLATELTTLLAAEKLDVEATMAALDQAHRLGTPAVDKPAMSLACRLGSSVPPDSSGYELAFALVRAKEEAVSWPCSAEETNGIWLRFKRYFDAKVEIRADFDGAAAYLLRWDEVLGRFEKIAAESKAEQGLRALRGMRAKVSKLIPKLQKDEACAAGTKKSACAWHCARAMAPERSACDAEAEETRPECQDRVGSKLLDCTDCCVAGDPSCKRLTRFICDAE